MYRAPLPKISFDFEKFHCYTSEDETFQKTSLHILNKKTSTFTRLKFKTQISFVFFFITTVHTTNCYY